MSTLPSNPPLTPEEYLQIERKNDFKSEFYKGEMFAMSGGSRRHDAISWQLNGLLFNYLNGKKCRAYTSNMRILVNPAGLYTYPDLCVGCEEPKFLDAEVDTLENPALIVEILSPSTERYDRGKKGRLYREMPSLKERLLISQDDFEVQLQRKDAAGQWVTIDAVGLDASVQLASIGYTLQLRELYEPLLTEAS